MEAAAQQQQAPAPKTTADDVLGLSPPGKMDPPKAQPEETQAQAPAPQDRLNPKFQALLQRDRATVDRERSVKAQEEAFTQRMKDLEEREKRLTEFESVKQKNPKKALELLGLSYEDLTNVMLSDGNIPPEVEVKRVESKLDSFLREQEEKEQRKLVEEKEAASAREQKVLSEFKNEISNYVKSNSGRYELIDFEQSYELVYDVIDGHYERTLDPETGVGEVLTIAQGADKVEEYLEKKYDKARSLNKMKALLGQRQEQNAPTQKNTQSQTPKTLTNHLGAQHAPRPTRPLTDDDRIQRAIAYAQSLKK